MKTKQNKKKNREFIHQLYYKNRINFIVTIILTIAMSSINLMISWLIQQIMDSMANQNMQSVVRMCMDCQRVLLLPIQYRMQFIEQYIQDFYNGPCSSTAIMRFRG